MTKLVFMDAPTFPVPTFEGLIESGYEIQAMVTQSDHPVGRKRVVTPAPIKEAALKRGIRVLQPEKISGSSEMKEITELVPGVIVTAAFGQFLPEKLLQVPELGAINVHASLFPRYRGGAPVYYTIMDGEKETGVTIMEMIGETDAGGIYTQENVSITKQDDVGMMFEKLSFSGRELLLETLSNILNEQKPVPQDEPEATSSPNITREQEAIDWHKTAEEIGNQVRGIHPQPIAFTTCEGIRWKLLSAEVLAETTDRVSGTIIRKDKKNLWIICGKQTVLTTNELQSADKGKQVVHDFLSGSGQQVQTGQQVK